MVFSLVSWRTKSSHIVPMAHGRSWQAGVLLLGYYTWDTSGHQNPLGSSCFKADGPEKLRKKSDPTFERDTVFGHFVPGSSLIRETKGARVTCTSEKEEGTTSSYDIV